MATPSLSRKQGPRRFRNRVQGGRLLARLLGEFRQRDDVVVLAVPRGGLPVASVVARALGAPLDIVLVRKVGLPGQPEFAIGAVGEGGLCALNAEIIDEHRVPADILQRAVEREQREIVLRHELYRGCRPALPLAGKTVIVGDDGLATGATMSMAIRVLRLAGPARIVVATPVAPGETCDTLSSQADSVVCAMRPQPFGSVGGWYEDFTQVEDSEARALLEAVADGSVAATVSGPVPPPR
jgi:putative phosphoribosyl transferase